MHLKKLPLKFVRSFERRIGYRINRIQKEPPYKPLSINYWWLTQLLYFQDVFELVADVQGDIVECGVGYGHSLFKLCCLAHYEDKGRKIYGFDSFEGFPEPSEEDRSSRNPQKGQWNVATVETIEQLLIEGGGFEPSFIAQSLTLIRGFFEDSLHNYDGESIALLHLDVDLYRSYKVTLESFWPKVAEGGVVLFDEYKDPWSMRDFPGAARAIDEFFGPLADRIQYNEQSMKYFIVKQADAL